MKLFFFLSLTLSLNAWAIKPPMPVEEQDALEVMLSTPLSQSEEGSERSDLRSRWRRLTRPLRSGQSELPIHVEVRLKELLERFTLGGGWSEESLLKLAAWMGVKETESFSHLPAHIRLSALNEVLDTYSKLPVRIIHVLRDRNKGIDLVSQSVTNHPQLAHLRGVTPRGWEEGETWEGVPGAGAIGSHPTIIAGDSLHQGHGTLDLILHEVGHTVDRFLKNGNLRMDLSSTEMFQGLHRNTPFTILYGTHTGNYASSHVEENFADMFAMYFFSERSRRALEQVYPEGMVYLESELF